MKQKTPTTHSDEENKDIYKAVEVSEADDSQSDHLRKELLSQKDCATRTIARLWKAIFHFHEQLENEKLQAGGMRDENSHLRAEDSRLRAEDSRLRDENSRLQAENSHLQAENSHLQAENRGLQSENTTLKDNYITLETKYEHSRAGNQALIDKNKSLSKSLRSRLIALEEKNRLLAKNLDKMTIFKQRVTSSKSWRWTSPLRGINNKLRTLVR